MSKLTLSLLIPETLDTTKLAAAVKTCVAADLSRLGNVKVAVSPEVEYVTLNINSDSVSAKLIEPNAIVRYLSNFTAEESALIDFEETVLYSFLANGSRIDAEVASSLSKLLPEKNDTAEAIIVFGDLQALVMARGKPALATDATVLMWHQKMLQNAKIKLAMTPAMKAEYLKPHKKEIKVADKGSNAASAASTAGSAASATPSVSVKELITPTSSETFDKSVSYIEDKEEIIPKEGARNVLITSALPYVNNVPHLGNIVGSTLSADFFSRYCKARGYNTLFICGTDEYGTATETKAIEEKVTPDELCSHYYKVHKEVYDWFDIAFDKFGRTSTPKQTEIAQDVFLKLMKNGFLEEKTSTQLYCEEHKGFLADRYVEGTCPKCGFDDARGDQCDGCGQLLDPFELIKPRCKLDGTTPVPRDTKHMFISLDKIQPKLESWLSTKMSDWPQNAQSITKNWIKEGLKPRSITRDLKWGTPVPLEGYEDKVLYVWFDAPIGYPSITANYTDKWELWWKPKNPKDIELFQFMGKDNAPFHAVVWPSSEIGAEDNWKLVDYLSTTEYLQYEGGKFSKSRGLGVFGNNAQEIGVPPSVWRYYLANARPETGDSQFSWSDFVTRNNSELLANLGNYVNRVVKFAAAKFESTVPRYEVDPNAVEVKEMQEWVTKYITAMEGVQLREGIENAMRFSSRGNQFLQDSKLDNTLLAENPAKCAYVVGVSLNFIYILSSLIYPYMPETSSQICSMLNVPLRKITDTIDFAIKPGHKLNKAQYLFTRIEPTKVDEWLAKYSGKQE